MTRNLHTTSIMDEENNPQDTTHLPLPRSVAELEALIKSFYGFNTPKETLRIDTCLKAVQKEHGAFLLADQLMNSADTNVRFFGALTFTVKINRDWTSLSASEGKDLLERILYWFITRVNAGDSSLVIRKLCSALIAVFKQTAGEWTRCVQHVVVCLAGDKVVDYTEAISTTDASVINSLTSSGIKACLWFGSILVEEIAKLQGNQAESDKIIRAAAQNTSILLDIIGNCLTNSDPKSVPADEPIKLLHTLGTSSHHITDDAERLRLFSMVLSIVSSLSPTSHAELFHVIADLATDLLTKDQDRQLARLLTTKLLEDEFVQFQQELQDGDFNDDSLVYGRLLTTIATTWLEDPRNKNTWIIPHLQEILQRLVLIAGAKGYPIEDDTLIPDVMIFWSSYVEWATEFQIDQRRPDGLRLEQREWAAQAVNYTRQVLEAFLVKLQLPPGNTFSKWERQTQSEFKALRRDFRDFSASAFTLLGMTMLDTLVGFLLRMWTEQAWQAVEITLQCIKGVIETVVDTESGDTALASLLNSAVFSTQQAMVPLDIRKVSIELIADCSPFLERQQNPPTTILEWLFSCINNHSLSVAASRTISALCDGSRAKLASNAPSLAHLWCDLASNPEQSNEVIERLALAVGSVLQALWVQSKNKSSRATALQALDTLVNSILTRLESSSQDPTPQGQDSRLTALQSLVNLARAFREVDGDIVELDDDEPSSKQTDPITADWIRERHRQFVSIITHLLQAYPMDGDLMEVICLLLRAGTTDDPDIPFCISAEWFFCLVEKHLRTTTRPGFLLETISRWLRQSIAWVANAPADATDGTLTTKQRRAIADDCLAYAMHTLTRIDSETLRDNAEFVAAVLDFETSYIPTDTILFFGCLKNQITNFLTSIDFATTCLSLPEPILKQAAAGLWTKLLDLRPPPGSNHMDPSMMMARVIIDKIPNLVRTLVFAVSGQAARSDLDSLLIPFRRLVIYPLPRLESQDYTKNKVPDMKTLLSAALLDPAFPSHRVGENEKRIFLEKLIRLRGEAAGTGRITKEWWVVCRGTFS